MDNENATTADPAGPRLLLDSARADDWARLLPTGIFHGVTTNPLLLERAGLRCDGATLATLAERAAALGAREIHLQTWGADEDTLVRNGLEIARTAAGNLRLLLKVPATHGGFRAAARLRDAGHAITMTAVYNPGQLLACAAAGAAYAAPYLGRSIDAGRDGVADVLAMHAILRGTGAATRLLVASLRDAGQVAMLAGRGLDTFTVGPDVAAALLVDPLTDDAATAFEAAARRAGRGGNAPA